MDSEKTIADGIPKIRVFVDYWNLQLTMNECISKTTGENDPRFSIDWKTFPAWVAQRAAKEVGLTNFDYEGTIIYASFNPKSPTDRKYRQWVTTWLDRQPGIQVQCRERRPKAQPRCNHCHQTIAVCPHCEETLSGTIEKGVDTAIVTDMIRLAWEQAYNVAVLVSLDADLIPAVEFLDLKGRKVVQAGFPPSGVDLATACWGSFDLFADRTEFERK